MLTNEENEAVLKYVAEHSSAEQAEAVLRRNRELLQELEAREKNVAKEIHELEEVKPASGKVGCPHCIFDTSFRCGSCLWTKAFKEKTTQSNLNTVCGNITFNGIDLEAQSVVVYSANIERLRRCTGGPRADKARAFLQGHIDWAEREEWGTKELFVRGEKNNFLAEGQVDSTEDYNEDDPRLSER